MRIQPGPSDAFCRVHSDAEYGHQDGELNFWMPLTRHLPNSERVKDDSVDAGCTPTLWVESKPQADDFHPVDIDYGAILMFHGALCRHTVPQNSSNLTRISMDFRIGVGPYYDQHWVLPGVKARHGYREYRLAS